jgi:hypothetical protein
MMGLALTEMDLPHTLVALMWQNKQRLLPVCR